MRQPLLFAVALGLGVACNNPSGGNSCRSVGADVTIDIGDQGGFLPNPVSVTKGQTVCWQNSGTVTHWVKTVVPATDTIDAVLPPSSLVEHGFAQITDVNYYCNYHPAETGQIHVR